MYTFTYDSINEYCKVVAEIRKLDLNGQFPETLWTRLTHQPTKCHPPTSTQTAPSAPSPSPIPRPLPAASSSSLQAPPQQPQPHDPGPGKTIHTNGPPPPLHPARTSVPGPRAHLPGPCPGGGEEAQGEAGGCEG